MSKRKGHVLSSTTGEMLVAKFHERFKPCQKHPSYQNVIQGLEGLKNTERPRNLTSYFFSVMARRNVKSKERLYMEVFSETFTLTTNHAITLRHALMISAHTYRNTYEAFL